MLRFTLAVMILAGCASAADVAVGKVTFQHDVLPILEKHCQGCHRPGQIAPMSFLTYETTRPWAQQIKAVVAAKKMPPSVGTPHYIVLTQGEGLTQSEADIITAWVNDGAPEGTARATRPAKQGQERKK